MKIQTWIERNINKSKFDGKNVFITGGNSGIGFALAKQVASLNANVFLLCRSIERATKAKEVIESEYPNVEVNIIQLDLADFSNIEKAVTEIKKYKVDYFVNNAGVYHLPKSTTKDGFEIIMGTNYLGTLYLSELLLPYLEKQSYKSHVVFESSLSSQVSKIDYDDFFMDKKYKMMSIYGRSKVAINNMYFNYLDEYKNVVLSLTHPGVVYTPLINKGYKNKLLRFIAPIVMKLFTHSQEKAALSLLFAMESDKNIKTGPRGLFGISGFPHEWKVKRNNDYLKSVSLGRNCISESCKYEKFISLCGRIKDFDYKKVLDERDSKR